MTALHIPSVLFALPRERMFFHHRFRIKHVIRNKTVSAWLCDSGERRALVLETGVGVANTIRTIDGVLAGLSHEGSNYRPSFMLFGGFAGALRESLQVADLVVAREVVDLKGEILRSPLALPMNGDMKSGRLLTSDRFIGEPVEKHALGERFGAVAVDMESAAFARRCQDHGVPWGCLRVISDDIRRPVAREVAELVEGDRVRLGSVLASLARKPSLLPQLWRLGRDTKRAARRLADGLVKWLAQGDPCSSAG